MRRRSFDLPRALVLLRKEITDLMRDRKVLFSAIILPALLFPLLLSFGNSLSRRPGPRPSGLKIGLLGDSGILGRIATLLPTRSWATYGGRGQVLRGELDAVLSERRAPDGSTSLVLLFNRGREASRVAAEMIQRSFRTALSERRRELLRSAGGPLPPLPPGRIEEVDLAPLGPRAEVPRLLPTLFILILISAAAFATLDLFPGERERGTLETLLVQPIGGEEIIYMKFLAIFLVGFAAILTNFLGLFTWSRLEVGGFRLGIPFSTLCILPLLSVPICLLVSSALVRVVARAKTLREGQHYLMPLALLTLLPSFLAGSPQVPLKASTALIPVAGPALAFREVSLGRFDLPSLLIACLSTLVYSGLLLFGAVKHLTQEEEMVVRDPENKGRDLLGRSYCLVLFSIFGLFSLSPFLTDLPPLWKILVPVLLFAGAPALLFGSWAGMPPGKLLDRRLPGRRDLLLAVACGIGLSMLAPSVLALQGDLLPIPEEYMLAGQEILGSEPLPLPLLLLIAAALPALFEELLYRRLLLERLLSLHRPGKALLLCAALFGLHHLSIFRFLPAMVTGFFLGLLLLRCRSFWVAPIAHAVSNALIILCALPWAPFAGTGPASFLLGEEFLMVRLPLALLLVLLPGLLPRRDLPPQELRNDYVW